MKYLLDTHTWIWWNARPEALSPRVAKLLDGAVESDELLLSTASIRELGLLLREGRLGLCREAEDWVEEALDMPALRIAPETPRVALRSTLLPGEAPADPVDQILIATAREEDATILTKDERLAAYPHARTLW